MDNHFNGLTPAEQERLVLLAEECAEVQQVIAKILRHGYESHHPNGGPSNRELLEQELGDLQVAGAMLLLADDVAQLAIEASAEAKKVRLQKYLHHQAASPAPAAVEGTQEPDDA